MSITPSCYSSKTWRYDAARIVEELFPVTEPAHWDLLLDLRQGLLRGQDWSRTLDVFLGCRHRCEEQHYLPFYRLRRLMACGLRLEAIAGQEEAREAPFEELLRLRHRSFADLRDRLERDFFEHALVDSPEGALELRIVER